MALESTRGETTVKGSSGRTELPTQFGRYQVKKKLGSGAMGTVYLAPPAGSSKKRWLIAVALVLPAMIGLWGCGQRPDRQESQRVTQAETDQAVSKKDFDRLSRENFDRLTVGMTLKEVAAIVGESGRQAIKSDHLYAGRSPSCQHTWEQAILAGRVWIWERQQILAAFDGDPAGDSKVEALFKKSYANGLGLHKPANKWVANKDNFSKLRVGMALTEVQDIIGIPPVGAVQGSSFGYGKWNPGWEEASKEKRVYAWCTDEIGKWILAAFPEPPTASSKAVAFSYVNSILGAEDKGILSGTEQNSPIGKWEETRPFMDGTKVVERTIIREFQKNGYLIVRLAGTRREVLGTWRQQSDRVYFSHPSLGDIEPAAKDRWFTIENRKPDDDHPGLGRAIVLSGKMEGERRFEWRESQKNFW